MAADRRLFSTRIMLLLLLNGERADGRCSCFGCCTIRVLHASFLAWEMYALAPRIIVAL